MFPLSDFSLLTAVSESFLFFSAIDSFDFVWFSTSSFKLETIFLDDHNIKILPNEFTKLANLVNLYLGMNYLSDLPKKFDKLLNLKHLDISNNPIKTLPEIIYKKKLSNSMSLEQMKLKEKVVIKKEKCPQVFTKQVFNPQVAMSL